MSSGLASNVLSDDQKTAIVISHDLDFVEQYADA